MENDLKIITWNSYKKNIDISQMKQQNLPFGGRVIINPTLRHNGFYQADDTSLFYETRTPRQIIKEDYGHLFEKTDLIVYNIIKADDSGRKAGYYHDLEVYYKPKSKKE